MRRLGHLISRFFQVLRARPLGPREQAEAEGLLREAERHLFWRQTSADQRHGLESAKAVLKRVPGRTDLARAALLHDVGKGHVRLGVVGRSLASGFEMLHLPRTARMNSYLEHEQLGAADLLAAGSEPLVVSYAGSHHGDPASGIDPEAWAILIAADK